MSVLPIFIVGIVFGLAMDYQVFLVSRMREEHVHGAGPTRAITEGFRHGARVVTGAALIMVGVFSGFIVEDSALIKSIGFALAFGILFDAFVVRMTLIPAADGAARRARVVAAALARPAAAARGRRGRAAHPIGCRSTRVSMSVPCSSPVIETRSSLPCIAIRSPWLIGYG